MGAARRSTSTPHMHVLVGICSNIRQSFLTVVFHTTLPYVHLSCNTAHVPTRGGGVGTRPQWGGGGVKRIRSIQTQAPGDYSNFVEGCSCVPVDGRCCVGVGCLSTGPEEGGAGGDSGGQRLR